MSRFIYSCGQENVAYSMTFLAVFKSSLLEIRENKIANDTGNIFLTQWQTTSQKSRQYAQINLNLSKQLKFR